MSEQKCKNCEHARVKVPVKNDEIVLAHNSPLLEKGSKAWRVFCKKGVWVRFDGKTEKVYYTVDSINRNEGLIREFSRGCEHFEEAHLSREMQKMMKNSTQSRRRGKKKNQDEDFVKELVVETTDSC